MSEHRPCPIAAVGASLLACGLLAGCAGATASTDTVGVPATRGARAARTAARAVATGARATAFAHAVNLRAGDLPGYASTGTETEAPEPGRYDLEYHRCLGGESSVSRLAASSSPELSAGRGLNSKLVKSSVEVWPTARIVALHATRSHTPHGRSCFVRFIAAVNRKINRERKGRMQLGPFTVTTAPATLPGATHGWLTRIDETRLHANGAVFFHVHRALFSFDVGAAEIELEAIGFVHPVPQLTEQSALHVLLARALANASALHTPAS